MPSAQVFLDNYLSLWESLKSEGGPMEIITKIAGDIIIFMDKNGLYQEILTFADTLDKPLLEGVMSRSDSLLSLIRCNVVDQRLEQVLDLIKVKHLLDHFIIIIKIIIYYIDR